MNMLNRKEASIGLAVATSILSLSSPVSADVEYRGANSANEIVLVTDDPWQPEGFVNGTTVPAAWIESPSVALDGDAGDDAWRLAEEVEVPLQYGTVDRAWIKAVYTDEEVFIRVRWADPTEDREHHPWVWDSKAARYVEGAQVEDSVMLSFEAGCEWTPSLLGGYIYDFDAWHWMAARSDPLGQAVDLYGNVQDRELSDTNFRPYNSRVTEDDWILKFTENQDVELHADWNEVDRVYMLLPVTKKLWVRAVPDGGGQAPAFVESTAAPEPATENPARVVPQYSPVKLTGGAAEVAAKGQWEDGYWTVEFRRLRHTPAEHIYDTIFNRMVQFSVQVFDQVERLDEVSESGRLFLRFLPPEQSLASN
jgi:hypothetical protein